MSPPPSPYLDEHRSVSEFSPGPVENQELLLRVLFNPEHVDDAGKLTRRAIMVKDLICKERGFSVQRMGHTSPHTVTTMIEEKTSEPKGDGSSWKEMGVAVFRAESVRSIQDEGEQVFRVVDTALEDNRGHASIYVSFPEKGPGYARKVRKFLLPFLQRRVSVDQAFQQLPP